MNELKKLNQSNNELDKNLNKENNLIMTDMVCYIRAAQLSVRNQELIRQDLLEMALSAQERKEDLSAVIGKDYKEFCNDVIASVPKMTLKEKAIDIIDIVLMCGSILCFIATVLSTDFIRILKGLFSGNAVDLYISYSVSTIVLNSIIAVVSVCLVQYILKTAFESSKAAEEHKKKNKRQGIVKRAIVGGMIGLVVATLFFMLVKHGTYTLISANIFVVLGIAGIMFLLHKFINLKQ